MNNSLLEFSEFRSAAVSKTSRRRVRHKVCCRKLRRPPENKAAFRGWSSTQTRSVHLFLLLFGILRGKFGSRAALALLAATMALALSVPAQAQEEKKAELAGWERSVVTIEVARKQYDYYQPWTKRTRRFQKIGTVFGDHQILTTADELFDRTLIRVQKGGRGRWWIGEVSWLDYRANLALVTVSDEKFWSDVKPATFGSAAKSDGVYQIARWREGKLENRRAEFSQFSVRDSQLCPIDVVTLETSSEIQGVGWGEPLIANSRVVGILWAQEGRTCMAIPSSFIQSILDARKKGGYHGLGYFHFFWQQMENPASLARLKLPGEPRGVVVIDVPNRPDGGTQVLKPLDIILKIDGFDLDIQGDYNDPEFGPLLLENLATRRKWAGDDVKMQIWREGKQLDVTYRLPKFEYTNSLVPAAMFDKEPEYLIIGGLVFEPLTESYLSAWGSDWKRRAPFRLNYYRNESPSTERPALVLLSQVLPDSYNIGYQEQRYLIVDKVNGQPVHRLSELQEALRKPTNNVHIIEFAQGDSLRRMVLAAGDAEREATGRVLKRYGITDESRFANAKN